MCIPSRLHTVGDLKHSYKLYQSAQKEEKNNTEDIKYDTSL